MEPVKTSDNIWGGIVTCLIWALIVTVVLAVAGWVFAGWIEFILYGEMNDFLKSIVLLYPMISFPIIIVYFMDREGLIR